MKRRCLGLALLAVALPVDVHVVAEDGVHAGRSTGLPSVLIFVIDDQRGG